MSDDVSDVMQAVAELAAVPFTPDNHDKDSQHIIDHFNGHRVLRQLIYNDAERMKHSGETGKSFTCLSGSV